VAILTKSKYKNRNKSLDWHYSRVSYTCWTLAIFVNAKTFQIMRRKISGKSIQKPRHQGTEDTGAGW